MIFHFSILARLKTYTCSLSLNVKWWLPKSKIIYIYIAGLSIRGGTRYFYPLKMVIDKIFMKNV